MNTRTLQEGWATSLEHPSRSRFLLTVAVLIACVVGVNALLRWLNLWDKDYGSVLYNGVFLLACVGLIRALNLSAEDVGLKVIKGGLAWHVAICLFLFFCYMVFYLLAIRISSLRPISSKTPWGILNYLVVAFAEEIYFRGILYGVVKERASSRTALVVSTLLFGLMHFRQGLGMLARFFTGWLFGSVRYSTGMIFMLIIPIHFAYNVVWFLFNGNWENQPQWAQFFPLFEGLLGAVIVGVSTWRARRRHDPGQVA